MGLIPFNNVTKFNEDAIKRIQHSDHVQKSNNDLITIVTVF